MTPAERVDVLARLASEWQMNLEEREALGWAVVMLRNDPQEAPDEALARYIQDLELAVAKQDVQQKQENLVNELLRLRNNLFAKDMEIERLRRLVHMSLKPGQYELTLCQNAAIIRELTDTKDTEHNG